jgi:RNA polymerase sigma factor (sigma-70 family)
LTPDLRRSNLNFTLCIFLELSQTTAESGDSFDRMVGAPALPNSQRLGGLSVRNLAYSLIYEPDPSRICETARLGYPALETRPIEWTESELAQIRLVLRKLTAQRVDNPEDAEDLVQETLLTMVRKAPMIDIEKGMLIWAMGILRKKVGNYYRRVQRVNLLDSQIRHTLSAAKAPSPESSLHHTELRAMIDGMLNKFPPCERDPIDLYLAGRQTSEIVSLLQPERYQNVVNRLHRGRKKLARALARHGYARRAFAKRR